MMRFYSTAGKDKNVSFRDAVLQGFAPDGGLYLPESMPTFSLEKLKKTQGLSFLELSIDFATSIFEDILSADQVKMICEESFNFPTPFLSFPGNLHLLELFHGPSFSFKDFSVRFLASLLKLWKKDDEEMVILVATSGDTGSAVGQAFFGMHGFRTFILFPKGRVTPSQKQQLTTIGHNVRAIEIDGSFEDCQNLLKEALLDGELRQEGTITVANSINVARLFPQALYYFYAYSQISEHNKEAIFAIPSGNFGHLVSGMLAKKMGLPVRRFLGTTNINDEVPLFLRSGVFQPHEAYRSLAVSMDVGNPSNFPRLLELYEYSLSNLRRDLLGYSVSDEQIIEAIQHMYKTFGYQLDPHSATAYLVLEEYLKVQKREYPGIFFATAHPAKFQESLAAAITPPIHIPDRLQAALTKSPHYISIPPHYESLKEQFFVKT